MSTDSEGICANDARAKRAKGRARRLLERCFARTQGKLTKLIWIWAVRLAGISSNLSKKAENKDQFIEIAEQFIVFASNLS